MEPLHQKMPTTKEQKLNKQLQSSLFAMQSKDTESSVAKNKLSTKDS